MKTKHWRRKLKPSEEESEDKEKKVERKDKNPSSLIPKGKIFSYNTKFVLYL